MHFFAAKFLFLLLLFLLGGDDDGGGCDVGDDEDGRDRWRRGRCRRCALSFFLSRFNAIIKITLTNKSTLLSWNDRFF